MGYIPSGCSKPQPAGAWHPPLPPPLQTRAERGEPCVVGGEGFPGVLTRVFIFGKRPAPSSAHPRLPPPQMPAPPPPFSCPCWGGRGSCSGGAGVKIWGGGNEVFFFEPPCLFCLRLKEGKIKLCVFCLSLWGASPGKRSGAGWPRLSTSVPDSWE